MKTILTTLMLLTIISIHSQGFRFNDTEHFNMSLSIEPYSSIKEKSPNFTTELELESNFGYVKAGIQLLPSINYLDITGGIGLNFTSGHFSEWRYYTGIRLGLIKRPNTTYPLFGQEIGIEYYFDNGFGIGLRGTNDFRSDFKWSGANSKYQQNGSIRLIKRF